MDKTMKSLLKLLTIAHMKGQLYAGKTPDEKAAIREISILTNETTESKSGLSKREECYSCIHKYTTPGNSHISCNNPDRSMTGDAHGIKNGWFMYPVLFDPAWKTKSCYNFKKK